MMKRGEVWLIDLNPGFGKELHKKRPALIISDNLIHTTTSHVIIIPASSQVPKVIGIEMVAVGQREGLDKNSVLLPIFIRSIDKKRLVKKIGTLSKVKMIQIERAMQIVLAIKLPKALTF